MSRFRSNIDQFRLTKTNFRHKISLAGFDCLLICNTFMTSLRLTKEGLIRGTEIAVANKPTNEGQKLLDKLLRIVTEQLKFRRLCKLVGDVQLTEMWIIFNILCLGAKINVRFKHSRRHLAIKTSFRIALGTKSTWMGSANKTTVELKVPKSLVRLSCRFEVQ